MERHEYRLGDVCTLRAGSAFKKKYQGLPDGDLPFIKVSDMNLPANQFRIHEANNWVSHATAQDIGARSFPAGTVVFAKIGEALKQNRVRLLTVPTLIDNNMMGAIPNPDLVDPYYLMLALAFAGLDRWATGTAMPYLTQGTLNEVPIELPDLRMQRKVAAVVAAYDELIENNLRRIEILEEMAQAVYREWFVNFRFPGHEDVALVDSPLGPIPEGWEARKFGTIADEIKDGVDPSTVDADVRYVGLEHIPQESFTLTEWGSAAEVASRKWRFTSGDVLFGKLRPYFHKVVEASFDGICSTDAIVIRPANGFGDLALHVAFSKEFVAHAVATSGGTDRPRAKWADLANFGVVVPDAATRALFSRSVRPMVDLAAKLARQNANLRTTRDLLLPKLVSGEIDVSDLDIDTEWLAS